MSATVNTLTETEYETRVIQAVSGTDIPENLCIINITCHSRLHPSITEVFYNRFLL